MCPSRTKHVLSTNLSYCSCNNHRLYACKQIVILSDRNGTGKNACVVTRLS